MWLCVSLRQRVCPVNHQTDWQATPRMFTIPTMASIWHLRGQRSRRAAAAGVLLLGIVVALAGGVLLPGTAQGDSPGVRLGGNGPRIPEDDQTLARQLQAGGRRCNGTYSDTLLALSPSVAAYEQQPGHSWVYCLRNTATYEQVYYGRDGKLKKRYLKAVAHGTGFAYRWTGQETLLLTNHHVATWPDVTDDDNAVRGVPTGSRKVGETLQIVRNDEDDYEPGFITLGRAVTDPTLDASVVKSRQRLNVMPYAIGSSAALRTGNAVEIRGYPLGAFAAANVGKVTNPYVEDTEGSWNHTDVALDALVNKGNSGSPMLAVSCVTGEYELVALFHAGFREGAAMNLAVGIDELRTLMDKLTPRPARPQLPNLATLTPENRAALAAMLTGPNAIQEIRFGRRLVRVRLTEDDIFSFKVMGPNYPADPFIWVRIDEPMADDAEPPRVTISRPLEPATQVPHTWLNGEAREQLQRVLTGLLTRLAQVQQYRDSVGPPPRSMAAHKKGERLLKDMTRNEKEQEEMLEMLDNMLERARALESQSLPPAAVIHPDEGTPGASPQGGGGDDVVP